MACGIFSGGSVKCWGLYLGSATCSPNTVSLAGPAKKLAVGIGNFASVPYSQMNRFNAGVQMAKDSWVMARRRIAIHLSQLTLAEGTITHMSLGQQHTCVSLASGTLKCWGDGYLRGESRTQSLTPKTIVYM